jgi:hypothetical protein
VWTNRHESVTVSPELIDSVGLIQRILHASQDKRLAIGFAVPSA